MRSTRMRPIPMWTILLLLAILLQGIPGYSQQPAAKIVSLAMDQNPVRITYDLIGSAEEEYEVALYLQRENDPNTLQKLEKVSGDVGTGKFAGAQRTIYWDKTEIKSQIGGMRFQFALDIRKAGGGSLPWYLYAGGAVVGVAVYLAVKPPPPPPNETIITPTVPIPPPR